MASAVGSGLGEGLSVGDLFQKKAKSFTIDWVIINIFTVFIYWRYGQGRQKNLINRMKNSDDFRQFARIGYLMTFYEIAVESMTRYQELLKQIEHLKSRGIDEYEGKINDEKVSFQFYIEVNEINENEYKADKEIIKIVIFLSTFLEAYIWELAAITLGETFTKNHLDKLDTLSKWRIIPKLITGQELNFNSNIIGDFKSLIKLRNSFVHHKTKDFIPIWERIQNTQEPVQNLDETINVLSFFNFIKKLFEELDKIDPHGNHVNRVEWYSPN